MLLLILTQHTVTYLKQLCLLAALTASAALFFAFNSPESASKVEWLNEKNHDFGLIKRDRPVQHRFAFKNISKDTIMLETVRTTCGCTAAKWTETPVAPGQEGMVSIEYDAYQRGSFNKKIRVFFDRQKKAEILRISGEVD